MLGTKIGFYEIKKQLGQGGMGAVYLAEHSRIGSRKVVKVLLPELSQNAQVMHRFENEARASAKLDHRHIIKIDDFGQLPSGQWYILMPFLEGSSLDDFLVSHGKLSIHQALHLLVQICAALHAAHGAGIVHRDLKPANVFLTHTEENPHHVTLLDFGIAKLSDTPEAMATQTGAAFGTPAYMAVEQFEDASRADARSDVYALGVIAYQMVMGTLPFGSVPGAVLYNKQITTRPPRPTGVPYEWAEILMRALALRPVDRPQSARDFAVALASVTPDDPPFEPSGTEILTTMGRELVTHAPPDAATVKSSSSRSGPIAAPSSPAAVSARPATAPVAASRQSGAIPMPALPSLQSHAAAPPRPARKGRGWWLAGALTLAGIAAAGIAARDRGTEAPSVAEAPPGAAQLAPSLAGSPPVGAMAPDPSTEPVGTAPPSTAAPGGSTAASTPRPAAVELVIDSAPAGATILIDGRRLGTAPQRLEARPDQVLELRAELPGRMPATREVQVGTSGEEILLRLERIKTRARDPERAEPRPVKNAPFDPNGVGGS